MTKYLEDVMMTEEPSMLDPFLVAELFDCDVFDLVPLWAADWERLVSDSWE